MAEFPYSPHPANVRRFFERIPEVGVPEKVTLKYLESLGFKSKNDRPILGILKSLGFLDSSGIPTERWKTYRNKSKAPAVMAQAIRDAYNYLFDTYPDAFQKDDETLRNFFTTHTDVGKSTLTRVVRTFKVLCELADFGTPVIAPRGEEEVKPLVEHRRAMPIDVSPARGLTVNVNIQLQLPATDDATIYDKLFEALKKHLLP